MTYFSLILDDFKKTSGLHTRSYGARKKFYGNDILVRLFPQISAQVSSQVRKELQALFYGSGDAGGELPESLLLWLSQRYVSTPDLRASLAALEMNILKNVSQQLELQHTETMDEAESHAKLMFQTVTGTVRHAAAAEGLTEEVANRCLNLP